MTKRPVKPLAAFITAYREHYSRPGSSFGLWGTPCCDLWRGLCQRHGYWRVTRHCFAIMALLRRAEEQAWREAQR